MKIENFQWVVLGLSLIISTVVFAGFVLEKNQTDEIEFQSIAKGFESKIQERLVTHEQILMGFKGFFTGSEKVEADEFEKFFEIQRLAERFPEIQGVGFNEYVSDEDRKNEINQEWKESGLDYRIFPEGDRDEYFPVIYLQPMDFRNERAIGFDIGTEKIRHDAIEKAIQTGEKTMTGKIILVQETEEDIQNGFLILLPVFDLNNNENNGELLGFVYAAYRINDFMQGISESEDVEHFTHINLQIYDDKKTADNLFFDSQNLQSFEAEKMFYELKTISFGKRDWILSFEGDAYHSTSIFDIVWLGLLVYGVSILFTYLTFLLTKNIQLSRKIASKEKVEALGELSGRLAHDIRNPLSNIRMSTDMLKEYKNIKDDDVISEKLHIIERNVERIAHQVDDVLDFVRDQPLEKKEMSVEECITSGIKNVNIPEKIKVTITGQDQNILGDMYQLEIVFKNLLINAVQAIGNKKGTIAITITDKKDFLEIVFEDSANNLDEIQVDQIFEPLHSTKQEGTGLGLTSCKKIIENHGGEISAKTLPTRFIIKLPKK